MKTLMNLVPLLALATPAVATADTLPKQVTDMECLVGTWKATGTVSMGGDTAKVRATWACKRASAKYGVLCQLQLTGIPGVPVYAETDLFGYEPGSSTYHWFSVTNGGETHDHVAKLPDANKLQFVYAGTQDGKPFKEVIDLELGKDEKTLAIRSETFLAGASSSVLAVTARK